jgi:drug/metabolite transporter (DMT)-like permease
MAGLFAGSIYFILENTALQITLASNVSLIICISPIFTAFLVFILSKRKELEGIY